MNNISQVLTDEKQISDTVTRFFKKFKFSQALQRANAYKKKGIPVIEVFRYLFQLVFTNRSMYMNMLKAKEGAIFMKDTVYRFLNSVHINWQTFLLTLASAVIRDHLGGLTSEDRINVFIVDDTFYRRLRSKLVEMLSIVHDHSDNRYKKGFRLLTLGWSDGNTFTPINFCLLASENVNKHLCKMKEGINKATNGFKRRMQAITKAPEAMLQMLKDAVMQGIPARHVLFDCWFAMPATIISVMKLKLHTIARLKNTTKIGYLFEGQKMTLSAIYHSRRKRRGRSRYLLSVEASICNKEGDTLDVRIVFVRDRNNRKKWIAILTTDMSLSEEEVIRIYGKRWNIEVFFKMCKSYLNLGNEFQGLSFDMMTAHIAVVYSRYVMLAVENRNCKDFRTLGELFYLYFDELQDIRFSEALNLVLEVLAVALTELFCLEQKQVDEFIDQFISKLPHHFQWRLKTATFAA